jgi:NtrC-family two-component system response regulator AlgB
MKPRALIIDDEKTIQSALRLCLDRLGCGVATARPGPAVLAALDEEPFDLVFLDTSPGHPDALGLLSDISARQPYASVVVMTSLPTIDAAVDAMRRGAADCLAKPVTPDQIEAVVERVTRSAGFVGAPLRGAEPGSDLSALELDTDSKRAKAVLDVLARAARSDAPILLRGESGTGKSVLARFVHARSRRARGPFVTVDCPTLTKDLMASELFGHARGSFTGALLDQAGRVEDAAGGTLFLDEVSGIPPSLQAKLLRFLQDRSFERIGETDTRWADVRVVAATNRDLERAVAGGLFHEDLLYRLNVIEVVLPPLRERREDVPRLARRLVASLSARIGRSVPELSPQAEALLASYDWPGNVRELRNVIERALLLCPADILELEAFSAYLPRPGEVAPRVGDNLGLEVIEREHIERVVAQATRLEAAARILEIDETTLRRKLKNHGGPRHGARQDR